MALISSQPTNRRRHLLDWEWAALLVLIIHVVLILYYYAALPAEVAHHFGGSGEPNSWGPKAMVWLLPLVGALLFLGMHYASTIRKGYSFPIKITEENREQQYALAQSLLRQVNFMAQLQFIVITYEIIQIALGNQTSLSWATYVLMAVTVIIIPALYFMRARKLT